MYRRGKGKRNIPSYGGKYSDNPRDYDKEIMDLLDNGMQDDEIPKIDIVKEYDPDNERVKTDPLRAALSLGMQQMPGGISGMQKVIMQFMKASEKKDWNDEEIDTSVLENMMFDPSARDISRIISLMEARYEEVEELEHEIISEKIRELKEQARQKMLEELAKRDAEKSKESQEQSTSKIQDAESVEQTISDK